MTSCPRCKGAVISDRDLYGEHQYCLICGWYLDVEPAPEDLMAGIAVPVERRTHKRYVFAPEFYAAGAPMPKREDFTSEDEHRALYRRWHYWNCMKPKETA